MRIALLSAVRTATSGGLAALCPFLGRTVLAAQFDLACELGAERIVCLADSQAGEILAIQHDAEQRGVDFHLISGHMALVGLVAADHELIVFQDGVLIDRAAIAPEMVRSRGIFAIPADAGTSNGFERIDAEWAWAGLFIARADVVERLADLPSDSDPASLLLRLVLQARVPLTALGADHLSAGTIMRVDEAEALGQHEMRLLNAALGERNWAGPGTKLAGLLVKAMLPKAIGWGAGLKIGLGALSIGAVALAGFDLMIAGGVLLVLAALTLAMLSTVNGLVISIMSEPKGVRKGLIINNLFDIVIIGFIIQILGLSVPFSALVLAPITLGLIRLAGLSAQRHSQLLWRQFWQDRVLLTLALVLGTIWGVIVPILATLSLAVLAFSLICEESKANSS